MSSLLCCDPFVHWLFPVNLTLLSLAEPDQEACGMVLPFSSSPLEAGALSRERQAVVQFSAG